MTIVICLLLLIFGKRHCIDSNIHTRYSIMIRSMTCCRCSWQAPFKREDRIHLINPRHTSVEKKMMNDKIWNIYYRSNTKMRWYYKFRNEKTFNHREFYLTSTSLNMCETSCINIHTQIIVTHVCVWFSEDKKNHWMQSHVIG